MDPVTAIFNFFSTPVGQTILTALIAADATIITKIGDLFNKAHGTATEIPAPSK